MVYAPSKAVSIHADLQKKITTGLLKAGDRLPTTSEIAKLFGCSVGMAGKVIAMLVHEGLVEQRRGLGTRVLRNTKTGQRSGVELDAFAFVFPSKLHEGAWRVVRGFQDAAHQKSRRVVTLTIGSDYDKELELVSRLEEFDVKAAAFYPVTPTTEYHTRLATLLARSTFPIVLTDLGLGRPSVVLDSFHAGYVMAHHLLKVGVTRIGFFANHSWHPSVSERYRGYLWALEEAGVPADATRIFLEPSMRPDFENPLQEPTRLALKYLEGAPDLEGVVCSNDILARGLIRAASSKGIAVPGQLKVVGLDDLGTQSVDEIPLTTYHVPFEEIGRRAFETLGAMLTNKMPAELETRIRGQLIVRDSA
jgi:GntR family transcriptional regulator of arabinose operon